MKPVDHAWVAGTLKSILTAINGLESLERTQMVERQRDILWDFKNYIGELKAYQDNEALARFDAAFKGAGWDEQGLRWASVEEYMGDDIFVVRFTNKTNTNWKIT